VEQRLTPLPVPGKRFEPRIQLERRPEKEKAFKKKQIAR
jgi:hypothetical protein